MAMVRMGNCDLELNSSQLGELRDSNYLIGDVKALRQRMAEDGYLFLRQFHSNDRVLAAREMILKNLADNGQLDLSYPLDQAVLAPGARGHFLGGSKTLTRTQTFLDLVESPNLMDFFTEFLGGPVLTYDYKWLRAVAPGEFTGAHYDIVYMGRGTTDLYTCWTPIGDVPYDLGPLAVLVGSHRFDRIKETYGRADVDRDGIDGWFSRDPLEVVEKYGGQWMTSEFKAGDVMIFGMFTMHGSLTNTSNRFRISCDTRYQLAHEPTDERWIGTDPKGHDAKQEWVPADEMRKKWGV